MLSEGSVFPRVLDLFLINIGYIKNLCCCVFFCIIIKGCERRRRESRIQKRLESQLFQWHGRPWDAIKLSVFPDIYSAFLPGRCGLPARAGRRVPVPGVLAFLLVLGGKHLRCAHVFILRWRLGVSALMQIIAVLLLSHYVSVSIGREKAESLHLKHIAACAAPKPRASVGGWSPLQRERRRPQRDAASRWKQCSRKGTFPLYTLSQSSLGKKKVLFIKMLC